MKKILIILFFLLFTQILFSQTTRFAIINSPGISVSSEYSLFDSVISRIDTLENVDFFIILGNLTLSGTEKEFSRLKSSLDKTSKPYYLIPGRNDFRDANGFFFFQQLFDDKFLFEYENYVFIGLSSVIPLLNTNHVSVENIDWLSAELGKINLSKEIIFFIPPTLDTEIDNWKELLSLLRTKNLQLIINGTNGKTELRNLLGTQILNLPPSFDYAKKNFEIIFCEMTKDTIRFFDNKEKMLYAIDKTIQIEKEQIPVDSTMCFNCDINSQINLNTTTLTSALFYYEGKIFTSDLTGLVSCIDSTGKIYWEYDTYGNIYGKPIIADRMLAAATIQGDIITLSIISGDQIQSIGFEELITTDLTLIDYKGTRELMLPKFTNSKSAIVFGTSTGKVYCYDFETLQEYWVNTNSREMISSKPVYVDNKILYTSRDGFLYCLDARTGLMIWRWKEKADTDLSDSHIIHDGQRVYVVSGEGNLYGINLLLGRMEWKFDRYKLFPNIGLSSTNKSIYGITGNNIFIIFNHTNGRIEKEIRLNERQRFPIATPFDLNGMIYFINNGNINFIDNKNTVQTVLFLGNAPVHPITKIENNKYVASNIDGRIIIFTLR